jgi:hypothetical protein
MIARHTLVLLSGRGTHSQRYRKSASLMPVQQKEWAPACVLLQKARTRLAFQCRRDQVRAGPSLKTAKALASVWAFIRRVIGKLGQPRRG